MKEEKRVNFFIQELKNFLHPAFSEITKKLAKVPSITDRNLDSKVMEMMNQVLKNSDTITIRCTEPIDNIYKAKAGRTPYDLLLKGTISEIPFQILLNNKFGDVNSNRRNDTTTYNNLLRLYLGIPTQRIKKGVEPNYQLVKNRIQGNEIITYAIYVFDKKTHKFSYFHLEELAEPFYINPRNSMFQVRYSPKLREKPMTFYNFVLLLLQESERALEKRINSAIEEKLQVTKYYEHIKKSLSLI